MGIWLQRYPWVPTAFAALIGAYLCARIVNTLTGAAIAPKPALLQQSVGATPQTTPIAARFELNASRLSRVFDVPLPPPPETAPAAPTTPQNVWQSNPPKSSLHAALIG